VLSETHRTRSSSGDPTWGPLDQTAPVLENSPTVPSGQGCRLGPPRDRAPGPPPQISSGPPPEFADARRPDKREPVQRAGEVARSIGRYQPDNSDPRSVRPISFLSLPELLDQPDQSYLVRGLIRAGSLVTLYGPSGCGKTFVALDLALSVAAGVDWLGAPVITPGRVAYVVAEGAGGVPKRVHSWLRTRHLRELPPVGFFCEPVLMNEQKDANALDALSGMQPVLIVLDTMARCSSGDENSVQEAMRLVRNCDRIRRATGGTVLLIHHTGINESRERGSSALRAACDHMIALSDDGDTLKLSFDKQKDDKRPGHLRLVLVPVSDTDSCVVRLAATGVESPRFTPSHRNALESLETHFSSRGASPTEWKKASRMAERTFFHSKKWLIEQGYVREERGRSVRTDKPVTDSI
jgi:hypothetical protein